MTVKHITKYHELNVEELNKLGTRELLNVLESARGRVICSCGKGYHCGDDVLDEEQQQWNIQQRALEKRLKEVLSHRENITKKQVPKKVEKKKMQY